MENIAHVPDIEKYSNYLIKTTKYAETLFFY